MIKPRSILQLTITGFLAVTGLLIVALVSTANQMSGLSDRSQRVVGLTAIAMNASRTLLEQTTAMERNARQFSIVRDPEIFDVYTDRRQTFSNAADRLRSSNLTQALIENISIIEELEQNAFDAMETATAQDIESIYQNLLRVAYQIADVVNEWADQQVTAINEESAETQRLLTLQGIFLVGAAVVLAGIFTTLITRPLIHIERVIARLGKGKYEDKVNITGPKDLVKLGVQLDWLRDRLAKLEQQRSSLLRHVSHELKTPLAAIQESASLLSDGVVGKLSSDQQSLINIQLKSVQRLQGLIDELLRHHNESFSVINSMALPVRMDEIIKKVLANHELTMQSNCLSIEANINGASIFGDPEQLRVIVDNLLSNAIRYSPRAGVIKLGLHQYQELAVVTIEDQGPGILESEIDKIFEAFYQGQQPPSGNYQGSGLGLAIVQEYVSANGGSIEVLPGERGARFEIEFPLLNEPDAANVISEQQVVG